MDAATNSHEPSSSVFISGCCSGNLPIFTDNDSAIKKRYARSKSSWAASSIKAFLAHLAAFLLFSFLLSHFGQILPPEEKILVQLHTEPLIDEGQISAEKVPQIKEQPQPALSTPPQPVVTKIKPVQKPKTKETTSENKLAPEVALSNSPSSPAENTAASPVTNTEDAIGKSPKSTQSTDVTQQKEETVLAVPAYGKNAQPEYPAIARRRGLEGTVLLEILVKEDGRADSIQVQTSSSHQILDEAAVTAVARWHFVPGSINGRPIAMKIHVPVTFHLTNS